MAQVAQLAFAPALSDMPALLGARRADVASAVTPLRLVAVQLKCPSSPRELRAVSQHCEFSTLHSGRTCSMSANKVRGPGRLRTCPVTRRQPWELATTIHIEPRQTQRRVTKGRDGARPR